MRAIFFILVLISTNFVFARASCGTPLANGRYCSYPLGYINRISFESLNCRFSYSETEIVTGWVAKSFGGDWSLDGNRLTLVKYPLGETIKLDIKFLPFNKGFTTNYGENFYACK